MSIELNGETNMQDSLQYICFIKPRVGLPFTPYMVKGKADKMLVQTKRFFLDQEIAFWFNGSESMDMKSAFVFTVTRETFYKDIEVSGMRSKLAAMLGWNYAEASRIIEKEERIFIVTVHPRFESIPYSFDRVHDDDDYALAFVEKLLSIRGGQIAFEEYNPEKHVPGYRYEG